MSSAVVAVGEVGARHSGEEELDEDNEDVDLEAVAIAR